MGIEPIPFVLQTITITFMLLSPFSPARESNPRLLINSQTFLPLN